MPRREILSPAQREELGLTTPNRYRLSELQVANWITPKQANSESFLVFRVATELLTLN